MKLDFNVKNFTFQKWLLILFFLISLGLFIKVMWFSNKNPYSKEEYERIELQLKKNDSLLNASYGREQSLKDSISAKEKVIAERALRIWNLERGIIKIKNKYEKEINAAGSESAIDAVKRFAGYTEPDSTDSK